jgi:hypothetical protein
MTQTSYVVKKKEGLPGIEWVILSAHSGEMAVNIVIFAV